MIIQLGDTVELLNDVAGIHPTEDRNLQKGDRVVVSFVNSIHVWYYTPRWGDQLINKSTVKKVNANHVEIKFR
jgi:hypothetical protein